MQSDEFDFYIGDDAFANSKTHNISYLMRGGMIDNWEMMEKFWHRSIHQLLRCEPSEHIFVLVNKLERLTGADRATNEQA